MTHQCVTGFFPTKEVSPLPLPIRLMRKQFRLGAAE